MTAYRILANRRLAGAIEREELSDNKVRYKNLSLIDRGVWTDAGSGQPTEYDPAELEVADKAAVNIMHDSESDASQAGYIEAESWTVENGTGYADVVLDLDTAAGQYADENLQETLESGGEVGFGGPSIEIPANGYDLEETPNGYPKLVNGTIEGLGFVKSPASKSTSFARQTAERGVAMSAGREDTKVYTPKDDGMSPDIDALREAYNLSDDVDEATIKELAEAGALSLEEDDKDDEEEEEEEMEEGEDEEGEESEGEGDGEEEEEEDGEDEVNVDVEALQSEVAELRSELEAMREAMMEAEEVDEELSGVREELSAAKDDLKELAEADTVEDLEKRLQALEDEPKDPKSLSDNGDDEDVAYAPISPSQSRGY